MSFAVVFLAPREQLGRELSVAPTAPPPADAEAGEKRHHGADLDRERRDHEQWTSFVNTQATAAVSSAGSTIPIGAHAYRDALQLGITENMKMTRMALGYMAGTDYAGAAVVLNVRIESATWDFDIARVPIHLAGTIIDETANRLILQTESAFLSIPKSTIESRVVTSKKRGVVWQPPANSP